MLTCHTRWVVTKVFSVLLFFFWFLHHSLIIHSCTQWLRAIHPREGIFTAFLFSIAKVRQSVIYKTTMWAQIIHVPLPPRWSARHVKVSDLYNGTTGREKEETISQLSLLNLCLKKVPWISVEISILPFFWYISCSFEAVNVSTE